MQHELPVIRDATAEKRSVFEDVPTSHSKYGFFVIIHSAAFVLSNHSIYQCEDAFVVNRSQGLTLLSAAETIITQIANHDVSVDNQVATVEDRGSLA